MKYSLVNIQHVADDIKSIKIQWATNIAKAALEIMINEIKTKKFKTTKELESFVKQGAKLLMQARSTEPMLFNGMKCWLAQLNEIWNMKLETKKLQDRIIKSLKMYLLDIQGEAENERELANSELTNSQGV